MAVTRAIRMAALRLCLWRSARLGPSRDWRQITSAGPACAKEMAALLSANHAEAIDRLPRLG